MPHEKREKRQGDAPRFTNIVVKNLEAGTEEEGLKAMFTEFGDI